MWLVELAIRLVLWAAVLIVGTVAAIIAGISWVMNWVRTRDDRARSTTTEPQAKYSDRR